MMMLSFIRVLHLFYLQAHKKDKFNIKEKVLDTYIITL